MLASGDAVLFVLAHSTNDRAVCLQCVFWTVEDGHCGTLRSSVYMSSWGTTYWSITFNIRSWSRCPLCAGVMELISEGNWFRLGESFLDDIPKKCITAASWWQLITNSKKNLQLRWPDSWLLFVLHSLDLLNFSADEEFHYPYLIHCHIIASKSPGGEK